jgi:uncharacterized protein YlxW (UPF0749 family)
LTGGTDQTEAALEEAQQRAATLQILAGTAAATGPGIDLQITDSQHQVAADDLLEALEELRDAGAEAIQITGSAAAGTTGTSTTGTSTGGTAGSGSAGATAAPGASGHVVRLVASSFFVDAPDRSGIVVDGVLLAPPYDIVAIGDPHTMSTAMGIPGGVLDTLTAKGARGTVITHDTVEVTALHQVAAPQYARPAPAAASGG